MKTVAIIPARGGSKGIKEKNSVRLRGKYLIDYTIVAALESDVDEVIVSTDSKKIKDIASAYGISIVDRPAELSGDDAKTIDAIQHAVRMQAQQYDAVVTLQPTSPLRSAASINTALKLFERDVNADSLVSVTELPHNFLPEKLMTLNENYLVGDTNPKARQNSRKLYARNGAAIYITRMNRIHQYLLGGNILPFLMSKIESFDIDDHEDLEIAEKLL